MKKIAYIVICIFALSCLTGCNFFKDKVNKGSKLALAKEIMTEQLNNFSYDVEITVNTGFFPVTTSMNCKEDRKNEVSHCITSTYGVETEEYIDYKNKTTYSKITTLFGESSSNGNWSRAKYYGENTNTWLNLNDYIFDLKEEEKDGGVYYSGTINSMKLANAISQTTDSEMGEVVNEDISISVFVNSLNYIEQMSFEIEIMGIKETVEIKYKNYNTSGNIIIPEEIK